MVYVDFRNLVRGDQHCAVVRVDVFLFMGIDGDTCIHPWLGLFWVLKGKIPISPLHRVPTRLGHTRPCISCVLFLWRRSRAFLCLVFNQARGKIAAPGMTRG